MGNPEETLTNPPAIPEVPASGIEPADPRLESENDYTLTQALTVFYALYATNTSYEQLLPRTYPELAENVIQELTVLADSLVDEFLGKIEFAKIATRALGRKLMLPLGSQIMQAAKAAVLEIVVGQIKVQIANQDNPKYYYQKPFNIELDLVNEVPSAIQEKVIEVINESKTKVPSFLYAAYSRMLAGWQADWEKVMNIEKAMSTTSEGALYTSLLSVPHDPKVVLHNKLFFLNVVNNQAKLHKQLRMQMGGGYYLEFISKILEANRGFVDFHIDRALKRLLDEVEPGISLELLNNRLRDFERQVKTEAEHFVSDPAVYRRLSESMRLSEAQVAVLLIIAREANMSFTNIYERLLNADDTPLNSGLKKYDELYFILRATEVFREIVRISMETINSTSLPASEES